MIVLRRPWQVTLAQTMALAPPVVVVTFDRGEAGLRALALALIVTLIWDMVFARAHRSGPSWQGITTALTVAVMVPPDLPLWQLALALSFGAVIGEQVFGGRGFGFLNAGVVTLAFLAFSFPGTPLHGDAVDVAVATVPGLLLLLATGLVFWRVLAGFAAGVVLYHLATLGAPPPTAMLPALTFGAVFLVADPVASAATQAGRWIYGLLAGLLVVLFAVQGALLALVYATLLSSLAVPLIDHLVILAGRKRSGWPHA